MLNKTAVVDERTRRIVNEAIDALRYRPNTIARGLAARSLRTVGVVINRFSSAYYGLMLDGAEASPVSIEPGPGLAGTRVLVVEDGPTITHGGMPFGAGTAAARAAGVVYNKISLWRWRRGGTRIALTKELNAVGMC